MFSKSKAAKTKARQDKNDEIRSYVLLAMFIAIIFLLTFTPIGFINLVVIKATIIHVPVIIGAILLGPKKGAVLGCTFGMASLISNTMTPSALSFAFSPLIPVPTLGRGSPLALLICFLPRILVGVVPWYVYRLIRFFVRSETKKTRSIELAAAGVMGALTNTAIVMGLIYFIFQDAYAQIKNVPANAVRGLVLGVVGTNGVPEAIFAAVLTAAVCVPLQSVLRQDALKGLAQVQEEASGEKAGDIPTPEEGLSEETRSALSAFEASTAKEKGQDLAGEGDTEA